MLAKLEALASGAPICSLPNVGAQHLKCLSTIVRLTAPVFTLGSSGVDLMRLIIRLRIAVGRQRESLFVIIAPDEAAHETEAARTRFSLLRHINLPVKDQV